MVDDDEDFPRRDLVVNGRVAYGADGRCPLLSADNRCTVYGRRPLRCRAFDCSESAVFLAQHPRVELLVRGQRL
jgi:Fe-S-cluster containining protein